MADVDRTFATGSFNHAGWAVGGSHPLRGGTLKLKLRRSDPQVASPKVRLHGSYALSAKVLKLHARLPTSDGRRLFVPSATDSFNHAGCSVGGSHLVDGGTL